MRILDFLSSQVFIMRPPPETLETEHGDTHLQFQHGGEGGLKQEVHEYETSLE